MARRDCYRALDPDADHRGRRRDDQVLWRAELRKNCRCRIDVARIASIQRPEPQP
jgi:hypothetical protein